jgi:putative membrane protein
MEGLIKSIVTRPYVFAFLAAYLFLAIRLFGVRRTIVWLISGYLIAFFSEYCSINFGYPYGEYHYIYDNLQGELIVAGVPFFDSLSYPFMIFAGFTAALFIRRKTCDEATWKEIFIGGLLTMALDIVVDPVAHLGERWFLGKIYYYAYDGFYFGVPASNFAGWLIVALAVIAFNCVLWRILRASPSIIGAGEKRPGFLYPAFYTSIALFNIAIAFSIRAFYIGLVSLALIALIVSAFFIARNTKSAAA